MVESKKYTVAIDLGESNVVVVVGSKDNNGMVTIDGIVSAPCEGVKGGLIDNIALVEESIRGAVTKIEESLNIRIMEAYAGISGEFVRYAYHSDHVYVTQPQNGVSHADVTALFERMRHVQAPDNEIIMERIAQNYIVDDAKEVKNPVGSFGSRLSSTFSFILCGNTPMQRLENALRKVGIKMLRAFPNALSVAESVLTSDEKEEGVAVVNIGSGLTDITIYYRNVVRYIASIPMGANAINQDIKSMMIPDKYIERLKCEYGSAVADLVSENKAIRVPGRTPRDSRNIMLYNLAVAIEARMAMLIDFVKDEIRDSGYAEKLPYGIVVSGGSACLANVDELFRRMTDMEVRIGVPVDGIAEESLDIIDSPIYATAVGILLRGMSLGSCTTGDNTPQDIDIIAEPAQKEPIVNDPPQKVEPQKVEPTKVDPPKVEPRRFEPPKQEIPTMEPPKIQKSQAYAPPPPRPYTPPTPAEQSQPYVPPAPVERDAVYVREQYDEDVALDEEIGIEIPEMDEDQEIEKVKSSEKVRRGFALPKFLRTTLDKLNEGFNAAGDEEI